MSCLKQRNPFDFRAWTQPQAPCTADDVDQMMVPSSEPIDVHQPRAAAGRRTRGTVKGLDGSDSILSAVAAGIKKVEPGLTATTFGLKHTGFDDDSARTVTGQLTDGGMHGSYSSTSRDEAGKERSWGVGGKLGGGVKGAVSARRGTVSERDETGKALEAESQYLFAGIGGIGAGNSTTREGVKTSNSVAIDPDAVEAKRSRKAGDDTKHASLSVTKDRVGGKAGVTNDKGRSFSLGGAFGKDGFDLSGSIGHRGASIGGTLSVTTDKEMASLTGDTASYALVDGAAAGAKLGISNRTFGASIGGSVFQSSAAEMHVPVDTILEGLNAKGGLAGFEVELGTAGLPIDRLDEKTLGTIAKDKPELYARLLASQMRGRVAGIEDLKDIDTTEGGLKVGEAVSIRSGEGWNVSGSVDVAGVSAGLGFTDQDAEQTTITRTSEGYKVDLVAMSSEEGKGTLSAGVKYTNTDTDTDLEQIGFEVTGDEGLRALHDFQETGLLPGAKTYAAKRGEADARFAVQVREYQKAKAAYDAAAVFGRAEARKKLRERAAILNNHLMTEEDVDLSTIAVPGVTYASRTRTDRSQTEGSFSLLGLAEWSWGETNDKIDRDYVEGGTGQRSYTSKHDVDNWFDSDETSQMVLNPQGGGDVGAALFSEQGLNQQQRESLASIEGLTGVPDSIRQAWVDGKWTDNDLNQIRMTLTDAQLEALRIASQEDNSGVWATARGDVDPFLNRADNRKPGGLMAPGYVLDYAFGDGHEDDAFRAATDGALLDALSEQGFDREELENPFRPHDPREDKAILELRQKLVEVTDAEKFGKLSEAQQALHLTSFAMQEMERKDGDPWNALTMAMAGTEPEVRERHMRRLFHVIERRKDNTHALTDLIRHIQGAEYLNDAGKEDLLSSVHVNLKDDRVEDRADQLRAAIEANVDVSELIVSQMIFDSSDLVSSDDEARDFIAPHRRADSADRTVDWLQAAEKAGGPETADKVMRTLIESAPDRAEQILTRMEKADPVRAKLWVEYMNRARKPAAA